MIPYVMMQRNPVILNREFEPSLPITSRYSAHPVNPDYYGVIRVNGLNVEPELKNYLPKPKKYNLHG